MMKIATWTWAVAFGLGLAVSLQAQVSITPHNLNNSGIAVSGLQVCKPCHTPHAALANGRSTPLWNHKLDEGTSYALYNSSSTYEGRFGANYSALDEASKLCLSCHDGFTAIDSYGGAEGTHKIVGDKMIGKDLMNDHPVGLKYPGMTGTVWTPTDGFHDPTLAVFSGNGIGASKGVQLVTLPNLDQGVGCRSCHHSHNGAISKFLRTSNERSLLCLKCHVK